MRIALYHNLPSGGAKRTLYEQTKRLVWRQHEVDVFTLSSANVTFADVRPFVADWRVYDFTPRPLFSSPWGRLNQWVRLADLRRLQTVVQQVAADIEAGDYDVLLVHPCQYEKCPSVTTMVTQTPTVYYCHEPLRRLYEAPPPRPYDDAHSSRRALLNRLDPLPGMYHARLKKLDWENTRKADKVIVNSRFIQTSVRQIYQVDADVSYHGIDSEWFRPIPQPEASRPFLFSVGSLTPMKGFDFLIESLARIPAAERPWLRIASNFQNPQEKAFLEQLAQERGVEVEFLGNVSEEQLLALYNQAYLVLYAPLNEPFGLVPLEAMACGTAVVVVAEGGTRETIPHSQAGLLVERDPEKFAQAVQTLLADPALAAEYGRNGRTYILQNWTWEHAIDVLEQHLQTAVGRPTAALA